MSGDVGKPDRPATSVDGSSINPAVPREELALPLDALAPTDPATEVVPSGEAPNPFTEGARAVEVYLRAQLSPRSRQNAQDALRRLVRLIMRDRANPHADPLNFPWPIIGYEQATEIRAGLYDMTRAGIITPGTANLTLSHLRGLFRAMHAMGLVTSDQVAMTHKGALKNVPGSRTPRGRALTAREERALRAAARALDGYQGAMLDTAIVVAIGAGLRREEIARLAVEGLSPGDLVVIGKGNKEKRMPIDAQMQIVIDAWIKERSKLAPEHGGLFCSPHRPNWVLSSWSFWSLVRAAAHNAFGDPKPCDPKCPCLKVVTGPHDFRRTFATRLFDQGFDIRQVQVLMAHESVETTALYDKRDVEALFSRRRNVRVIA